MSVCPFFTADPDRSSKGFRWTFIRNEFPYPPHDCLLFFSSRQLLPAFARSHRAVLYLYYAVLAMLCCCCCFWYFISPYSYIQREKRKKSQLVIPFWGSFSSLAWPIGLGTQNAVCVVRDKVRVRYGMRWDAAIVWYQSVCWSLGIWEAWSLAPFKRECLSETFPKERKEPPTLATTTTAAVPTFSAVSQPVPLPDPATSIVDMTERENNSDFYYDIAVWTFDTKQERKERE